MPTNWLRDIDKYLTSAPDENIMWETLNVHLFESELMEQHYNPKTTPDDLWAEVEKEVEEVVATKYDDFDFNWAFKLQRTKNRNESLGQGSYAVNTTEAILHMQLYEKMLADIRQHLITVKPVLESRSKK